jgi:hypothetical protein
MDYLARVQRHLMAVPPAGQMVDLPTITGEVAVWHARSRALFAGVRLLLTEGLPFEAAILVRSLFETSLRAQYLEAADEPKRHALILRMINDSTTKFEHLEAEYERVEQQPTGTERAAEWIRDRRRAVQQAQAKRRIPSLVAFPSENELATRFGRRSEYLAFLVTHDYTHGSFLGHAARTRRLPDGSALVFHRDYAVKHLVGIGLFAAKSSLIVLDAAASIVGWEAGDVGALLRELDDIGESAGSDEQDP